MRQVGGIAVAVLGAELAFEKLADLLTAYADGGQHDVAGRQLQQLHDPLAQVALDGIDAPLAQVGRKPALLGEHRLALDEVPPAVLLHQTPHRGVHLVGVGGPVHRHAIGRGVAFELFEVMPQMAQRMALDLGRHAPQVFPFGHRACHLVALFAYGVKRLVVPRRAIGVGDEFRGGFGWVLITSN